MQKSVPELDWYEQLQRDTIDEVRAIKHEEDRQPDYDRIFGRDDHDLDDYDYEDKPYYDGEDY